MLVGGARVRPKRAPVVCLYAGKGLAGSLHADPLGSLSLKPERGLEDDRRATKSRPPGGRLYSVTGTAGSGSNPTRPISSMSWPSVRKHCARPENCVNTNASPFTGSASGGSVARENVNTEEPGRRPGHPGGFGDGLPEDQGRRREVPDAVGHDQIEAPVPRQYPLHRRQTPRHSCAHAGRRRPGRGGAEHGPRQVEAENVPTRSGQGTALRPSPHPRSRAWRVCDRSNSTSAKPMSTALGGDAAKLRTVSGALQLVPPADPRRSSLRGWDGRGVSRPARDAQFPPSRGHGAADCRVSAPSRSWTPGQVGGGSVGLVGLAASIRLKACADSDPSTSSQSVVRTHRSTGTGGEAPPLRTRSRGARGAGSRSGHGPRHRREHRYARRGGASRSCEPAAASRCWRNPFPRLPPEGGLRTDRHGVVCPRAW